MTGQGNKRRATGTPFSGVVAERLSRRTVLSGSAAAALAASGSIVTLPTVMNGTCFSCAAIRQRP